MAKKKATKKKTVKKSAKKKVSKKKTAKKKTTSFRGNLDSLVAKRKKNTRLRKKKTKR